MQRPIGTRCISTLFVAFVVLSAVSCAIYMLASANRRPKSSLDRVLTVAIDSACPSIKFGISGMFSCPILPLLRLSLVILPILMAFYLLTSLLCSRGLFATSKHKQKKPDASPKTERASSPAKTSKSSTKSPPTSSKKKKAEESAASDPKEDTSESLSASDDSSSDSGHEHSASPSSATGESSSAPSSSGDPGKIPKKLSWLDKKKKGLASRAAGSSLGNALFQKYVDKNTQSLISSICDVIKLEKSSKEAKKTKEEILKVATKILLLYNDGKVTDESFSTLVFSFRRICSAIRNAYHAKNLNEAVAQRIHGVAMQFYANLQVAIAGLVSDNTLNRIQALIDYIFSVELLTAANKYPDDFQKIAMVLAGYLEGS